MWMRICSNYDVAYVREPLQKCSSDHINRSFANKRFLVHWAMLDWNLERVVPDEESEWSTMRKAVYRNRRKRLLYLSATQLKRLHFRWAIQLAWWAFYPELNPLIQDEA
jgi:hypothetical protein